jgi:hypothetical protein
MLLQQQKKRRSAVTSGARPPQMEFGLFPGDCPALPSMSSILTTDAAPDPIGFSPVRVAGGNGDGGRPPSRMDGDFGSMRCCDGDAGSLNTAPTEDDEDDDDDGNNPEKEATNKDGVARPTLLSPSVAWSWYKPTSGTRSLFEMDDEEDEVDLGKKNVTHVGNHHVVTYLSPPELVASTTADSFDFSEVGWGSTGAGGYGKCMSPLRRAAPEAKKNHALEFAFAWTDPKQTPPMARMQTQLPYPASQLLNKPGGSIRAAAPDARPKAGNQEIESPTPSSQPYAVEDSVSPLAMESPLARSGDNAVSRRLLLGQTGSIPPPLALNEPPDLGGQGRRQSQRAAPPPATPGSTTSLLNRRQSPSYGDLPKAGAKCAAAASCPAIPAPSKLVTAASGSPASRSERRHSAVVTASAAEAKSPKSAGRRATTCATAAKEIELLPLSSGGPSSNKKAVRTIKVRAKDLAGLVGGAPTSPSLSASPTSTNQGGRRRSSSGNDLKALWDALRKVGSGAAAPRPSSASPDRRLIRRRSTSRRETFEEAGVDAEGGSKSSVCAVAPAPEPVPVPTPVRSRSRSCTRRRTPRDRLSRSASVGTGLRDARGRTTADSADRTSRSGSRTRRSGINKNPTDGPPNNAPPVGAPQAFDRRTTKVSDPDGSAVRGGGGCPSSSPVRRSRSFEEAPTASPTTPGFRRSSSMGSGENRQRYVRPGQTLLRRQYSSGSESPDVGDEEGRRRRPSLCNSKPPDESDDDPRRRCRRRSSSRQRRTAQPGSEVAPDPIPSRRRSRSRGAGDTSRRPSFASPASPERQSSASPRPFADAAFFSPPALRRTGSDAARDAGFTDEQLRRLQDAGFHISPRTS